VNHGRPHSLRRRPAAASSARSRVISIVRAAAVGGYVSTPSDSLYRGRTRRPDRTLSVPGSLLDCSASRAAGERRGHHPIAPDAARRRSSIRRVPATKRTRNVHVGEDASDAASDVSYA